MIFPTGIDVGAAECEASCSSLREKEGPALCRAAALLPARPALVEPGWAMPSFFTRGEKQRERSENDKGPTGKWDLVARKSVTPSIGGRHPYRLRDSHGRTAIRRTKVLGSIIEPLQNCAPLLDPLINLIQAIVHVMFHVI